MKAAMKQSNKESMATFSRWLCAAMALLLTACGPGKGSVTITSTPTDATITVNGVSKGTTPATLEELPPGQYVIEVQKEGYDTAYKTVALLDKQKLNIELDLPQTMGLLLVDSVPQGVDVLMDGVSKGKTPLLLTELGFGSYKLDFKSPIHLPLTMQADLVDRKPVRVCAELTSNTATLVLDSKPAGADVLINGVVRGTTPVTLDDVVVGKADVKVAKVGYKPYARQMDLEATGNYEITAELEALPSGLTVDTKPAGAAVTIDGQPVGSSPLTVNVADGSREVKIVLMGYETVKTNMVLKPNVIEPLELDLVKNSGTLVLDTEPADVKVYINGELYATTEPKGGMDSMSKPINILLTAGVDHTIQLVHGGYAATTFTLQTELDQLVTRHEALKRIFVRDTMITTKTEVIKCRLEYKLPNGNMYFERFPGVYDTVKAEDIVDVQSLGLDDESNREARRLLELNKQVSP